jgi:predicted RNA-binding Zn-ribbon protein involved in translation (DUF1610 family)
MPISAACPNCAATIKAPDQLAGKKIHCPKCGERMSIPNAAGPTPDWMVGGGGPQESEAPYRLIDDEPAPSPPPKPVPPRSTSFVADEIHAAADKAALTLMKCPACGATVSVPDAMAGKIYPRRRRTGVYNKLLWACGHFQ